MLKSRPSFITLVSVNPLKSSPEIEVARGRESIIIPNAIIPNAALVPLSRIICALGLAAMRDVLMFHSLDVGGTRWYPVSSPE